MQPLAKQRMTNGTLCKVKDNADDTLARISSGTEWNFCTTPGHCSNLSVPIDYSNTNHALASAKQRTIQMMLK
jgi:hypothetical protein